MIIAFEGMDASGKNTQSKRLVTALKDRKITSQRFDFPQYGSYSGQPLLMLLKRKWECARTRDGKLVPDEAMTALSIQALQTINRYEHLGFLKQWECSPEEEREHSDGVLVLDRYFGSGLAYGAADGLDLEFLMNIHRSLPMPELWLLLDVPADESVKRRPERRDEYEKRQGFMGKVRDQYLSMFKHPPTGFGDEWVIVDGMGSEDEVHARIMNEVETHVLAYLR
jgi:dTMP kinase